MVEKVLYDKDGTPYVVDAEGNHRPPMQSAPNPKTSSGFTTYDSSQGHCGLCGHLRKLHKTTCVYRDHEGECGCRGDMQGS